MSLALNDPAIISQAAAGDEAAIHELIDQNNGLVRKIAYRFQDIYSPELELDDLIQLGNLGIVHAIKKFNPGRKVKFSTYTYYWIRHYIWRYGFRDHKLFQLTHCEAKDLMTYRNAFHILDNRLDRTPTVAEIAGLSKMSGKRVKRSEEYFNVSKVTFDDISEKTTTDEHIPDQAKENLLEILEKLKEPGRSVINLRFGLDGEKARTIAQVATALHLPAPIISAIEKETIEEIRIKMVELIVANS